MKRMLVFLLAAGVLAAPCAYDAFSPEQLRASLQRLIDEPDLRARLSAGAPHVKTIEQDAREWDERYRGVLDDRSPSVL